MIQRMVKLPKTNSFFLFGARGTGKTTLLKKRFPAQKVVFIDLLDIHPRAEKWLISNDPLNRQLGSTYALHWKTALVRLYKNKTTV